MNIEYILNPECTEVFNIRGYLVTYGEHFDYSEY